jgi:hypothetical protein
MVEALGTTIGSLTFEAPNVAVVLFPPELESGYVEVRENTVKNCGVGIWGRPGFLTNDDSVRVDVVSNTISDCSYGVLAGGFNSPFSYAMNIRNNLFENLYVDGVRAFSFSSTIDIIDNQISGAEWTGIWVGSWRMHGETDPEWGENPPVNIIGNTIYLDAIDASGIMVGSSAHGVNNVLVKNNVLKGQVGYGGLVKQPYGHNNHFIGNDLSELTTNGPQIWLAGGRDNLFLNNTLGKTEEWIIDWLPGAVFQETAATLSSTINWHLEDLATPDPVNSDNVFIANNYRVTGLPGWDDENPDNAGSVLLLDYIQRYSADGSIAYEYPVTTENIVIELGKFPMVDGNRTDVCTQVRDISNLYPDDMVPGTNRVAGWRLCEGVAMHTDDDD